MKKIVLVIALLGAYVAGHSQLMFHTSEIINLFGRPKAVANQYLREHNYFFKKKEDVFYRYVHVEDIEGDYKVDIATKQQLLSLFTFETDIQDISEIRYELLKAGFVADKKFAFGNTRTSQYILPAKNIICTLDYSIASDVLQVIYGRMK